MGIKEIVRSFIPVSGGAYWFISCYISLYVISPFLNKCVRALSKKEHCALLILLLCMLAVPKIWGYFKAPLVVFITLYLIAAYVRLYCEDISIKTACVMAMSCIVIVIGWALFIDFVLNEKFHKGLRGYFIVATEFSPVIIALSVSLLLIFRSIKIGINVTVNRIAAATLGVYLIHDNQQVRPWLWNNFFSVKENFENLPFVSYVAYSLRVILLVYVICTCIDLIRTFFMRPLCSNLIDRTKKYDVKIRDFFNP